MLLLAFTAKPNDTHWFPSDGHQHGLSVKNSVGFKTFFLYLLSFFPSLARAGLVEELRHLYVVVILWSGACARSKILR